MKAVYVQPGKNLDYRNNTGKAIDAGTVVVIGERIGVAGTAIGVGELGSVVMEGVFKLTKKAGEALSMGTGVSYGEDGMTAATEDAPAVAYVAADAAENDTTVAVKLLG